MLPIQTILHPTDFSDRSGYALHLAEALARDYHAQLVILHVIAQPVLGYGEGVIPPDMQELIAEAKDNLARMSLHQDIRLDRRYAEGDPASMILHHAHELNADLIVMGSHGRTGLRRMLMGSTAEQVSRRAFCPVLTVTSPFPAAEQDAAMAAETAFADAV